MPTITNKTASTLIKLGILDKHLEITPNAIIPYILRKPVNEQCSALNIRCIYRRPGKRGVSVEDQVANYLVNKHGGYADTYEGSHIKWILSSVIEDFDPRRRKYRYKEADLNDKLEKFLSVKDEQILKCYERYLYWQLKFSDIVIGTSRSDLIKRFNEAELTLPYDDERITLKILNDYKARFTSKRYYHNCRCILSIWRSLPRRIWRNIAWTCLTDWERMCIGWPDITFVDKNGQLTLFEVKSNDKLHSSQIYVIEKLKRVLGNERIAVAWVSRNDSSSYSGSYEQHVADTNNWLSLPVSKRK